jgi:hypothetical protein
VIDTLAVVLRFIARRKSKLRLALDDWLIAASLIPAHCMIIIAVICNVVSPCMVRWWIVNPFPSLGVVKGGAGRRTASLTSSEKTLLLKVRGVRST